jgi:hypothetical protein
MKYVKFCITNFKVTCSCNNIAQIPATCVNKNYHSSVINPFQSNFSANRILPSSYLFWAVKRLVDYLLLSYSFKREKHGEIESTTCAICWLKSVLHEEKRRTGSDSGRTNAAKTVSDVFRHRSRTGKLYCRTRSDVGSERAT